ncbi:hypothetical protein Ndes2526B_g06673 [Nannochloris sp. 'desiccata']
MSGGEVGALLSIVTSDAPFQDAIAALQVVSEGGLSRAASTLKRLLHDQMLYSTSHQLQTVSLLYYTDPSGAISTLEALAAQEDTQPAVLALATTLLQQNNEGSSFASISNLTASEYIKRYKIESSSGSAPRPQTHTISIKRSLLPKDERAAIEALKQQAQVDHLEQLAALVTPAEISAAATHNPELASEVITVALEISEDAVEPSALAAFISYSIQRIISIEDRTAANRAARMLVHLIHRIIDKNNPAVWIVALELEGLCTQFISQEVCATLYAKLAAMGEDT